MRCSDVECDVSFFRFSSFVHRITTFSVPRALQVLQLFFLSHARWFWRLSTGSGTFSFVHALRCGCNVRRRRRHVTRLVSSFLSFPFLAGPSTHAAPHSSCVGSARVFRLARRRVEVLVDRSPGDEGLHPPALVDRTLIWLGLAHNNLFLALAATHQSRGREGKVGRVPGDGIVGNM
jgi:hypothetical protein